MENYLEKLLSSETFSTKNIKDRKLCRIDWPKNSTTNDPPLIMHYAATADGDTFRTVMGVDGSIKIEEVEGDLYCYVLRQLRD